MKINKFYTAKAKDDGDRTLTLIGSDETKDRSEEVILISAWDLKAYKTNPIILLNHNSYDLPIAKTIRVWKNKAKQLCFKIQFPEPEVSKVADTVYKLYKDGFMRACSVGFKPDYKSIVWGDTNKDEPYATYTKVELLELSLCSIGCNPNALSTSKGITEAIEAKCVDELEVNELVDNIKDHEELVIRSETPVLPSKTEDKEKDIEGDVFKEFMVGLKEEIEEENNIYKTLCESIKS